MRKTRTGLFAGLLTVMTASWVSATPVTLPSGLNPGDTYYLAFITAGTRNGASSNIADYDAFVTAQANTDANLLALGTTWKVIGSTDSVSAVTHVGPLASPIYNLAGQLLASSAADLFDGQLNAPVVYDQHGTALGGLIRTGSTALGAIPIGLALGDSRSAVGNGIATNGQWLDSIFFGAVVTDRLSFYGISGELTVPAAAAEVPEPGTVVLLIGPALLLVRRRQRPRRVATDD
jgi:hypothetical protein